jgi:asparagine synthase (glutamine-hydrolysing)
MTAICGMIGEWARAPQASSHLDAMLKALAGDGPGGHAAFVDPGHGCMLGVTGRCWAPRTPRVLRHGTLVAVCDGHLFDRAGVIDADERLLRAWAGGGARALGRLDAQFALAVWDGHTERLTLARDALGVRSLYFYEGRGGVVFASTIEALLCHPEVPIEVDARSVSAFLTFLNVPAPGTLFQGISKLPPGSYAQCGMRGVEHVDRFWDLLDDPLPEQGDLHRYAARVRELHREAVEGRIVAGPMGALLSGGNDSSANVALMAKLGVFPLHTFTVGLAEWEGNGQFSDLVHARRVAQLVGSEHHERLISVDDFIKTMSKVTDAQDDLVSEPSSVFLYHALQMVREQNLGVVVTGEANDEISCGHGGMIRIRDGYYRRWKPLMRTPRVFRRLLALAAPMLSPTRADVFNRAAADGEYFWSFELGWTDHDKPSILTREAIERTRGALAGTVVAERARRVRSTHHGRRDYLAHVIATMMQDHYLGNLMLGKLEQLSSRLGVEARCPYTAPPYVHFVYNIPSQFKARNGEVKAFFRTAISDLLPHEIIHRPKQGFRTPTPELFRGRFGDWAEPRLLESGLTNKGLLRRDTLATLLAEHRRGERDHSTRLWTALVLNLWHERWVAGVSRARSERTVR